MTKKRIQVRETARYHGDFEGSLESIIRQLQSEVEEGWEGLESEYEYDYGGERYMVYNLYRHREENDKEYGKRMKLLEKQKQDKAKAKERRRAEYLKLKKEFDPEINPS